MKFQKFTPNMCDKISNKIDIDFPLFIKTKEGDILNASLQWRQGRGDNYYFESNTFGFEINLSTVIEISYTKLENSDEI